MKNYKGYYIDNVYFHNEAEIDAFVEKQAVNRFITLNKIFSNLGTMEASIACDKQAEYLHKVFGYSWEKLEELEIKAFA